MYRSPRGDLTVVMETYCESTKEVTEDIDMTNIFFLISALFFFLCHSLLYMWPICLRRFPLLSFCSRPRPSHCSFHSFSSCSCPSFPVQDKCVSACVFVCTKVSAINHMSVFSPLRYQQDKESYKESSHSGYCLAFESTPYIRTR